jgi:hypothetical protein
MDLVLSSLMLDAKRVTATVLKTKSPKENEK